MARIEYRHLHFTAFTVEGDERRKRGWRKDGALFGVYDEDDAGSHWRELYAREGASWQPYIAGPPFESNQAFLAFLNGLGLEGWRVVSFSPHVGAGGTASWPYGDFLLARES
jgi:hypothetical protein